MLLFAGKGIRILKVERHIVTDDEYDDIKPIPITKNNDPLHNKTIPNVIVQGSFPTDPVWMTVATGIGVVIVFGTMAFIMIYGIIIGMRELLFR